MMAGERSHTMNIARQLISDHLVEGRMDIGEEIGLKPDQVLLQDATGTLSMLMLEAIGIDRVRVPLAVQYVDHNLVQADSRNPEDHLYLETTSRRFGIWFSRPGNGISHPVHMEAFGVPGALLVGADSHTCAAGSLAMLAIGAGSGDIAAALTGEPIYIRMPAIMGVRLLGRLPEWVSAKDVILEMLRRHTVKGGVGRIIEYYGPGLATLSAMDRHVIANMGAELGATTTVFPSDEMTRTFLQAHCRTQDWRPIPTPTHADYDFHDEIDLNRLEPLIAKPSSPDNVVPVREVAGEPIYQAYLGSSANPGFRDFEPGWSNDGRSHLASPSTSIQARVGSFSTWCKTDFSRPLSRPAAGSIKRGATAAWAWVRRQRAAVTPFARCRAISPADRAQRKTACSSAVPRRRPPQLSLEKSLIRATWD
jgi:aconitate hydratase